ncbi:Mus81, partial [Symbiodinium microadriaticum]
GSAKQQREDLQREVVVLDCIVERKTVLDLASSIVDGRYEEQKQRLSSCGVQHVVYLVEGVSLNPQGLGRGGLRATHSRGGAGRTGGGGGRSGAEGQRGGGITSATILTAMASTQ